MTRRTLLESSLVVDPLHVSSALHENMVRHVSLTAIACCRPNFDVPHGSSTGSATDVAGGGNLDGTSACIYRTAACSCIPSEILPPGLALPFTRAVVPVTSKTPFGCNVLDILVGN